MIVSHRHGEKYNNIINIKVQEQPYPQRMNRVLSYVGNVLTKNDPGKTFENLRGVTQQKGEP